MRPKTVLLHIGTPKTGTTSIQNSLTLASKRADLQNVCYPRYKNDSNQSRLMAYYRPEDIPVWMLSEFPTNDERFQAWRLGYHKSVFDQLQAAAGAILSAESLSTFTAAEVTQLRKDLESVGFEEFHIVLYIRDPADFYLSLVQQRLKATLKPSLPEDPCEFTYPFRQITQTWEQIFPGKLIVRPFRADAQHDVADDFNGLLREHMGVSLPRTSLRLNKTLSAEGMQILQDYRQRFCRENGDVMTADAVRLVRFLEQSTEQLSQTTPTLKAGVAEQIRTNHRPDLELIASRYGTDLALPKLKAPDPRPAVTTHGVQDILESVDPEIVYRLLLRLARTELGTTPARGSMVRIATHAYRTIPRGRLSPRLVAWLRSVRNAYS